LGEGGYQDGNAEAHWLAAQREILSNALSSIGRVAEGNAPVQPRKAKASRKKQRAA
jgi:hypothetical protein